MKHVLSLTAALAVLVTCTSTAAAAPATAGWRVSITNLTPAGSQPFTPPLLAVHSRATRVWRAGAKASRGVALVAEDGSTSVLETALGDDRSVRQVLVGDDFIAPGATRRYTVRTRGAFDRLSVVTMLVNTNDGFTGLDSLRLRDRARTVRAFAYDAGSERNNESVDFVPGPCCGSHDARDPESEPIRRHPGIAGGGGIDPARYGWQGPVARISIVRMR